MPPGLAPMYELNAHRRDLRHRLRSAARQVPPLVWLRRRYVGLGEDLLLYVLTVTGTLPSHRLRRAVYRAAGVRLPRSSALHWRARFYRPSGVSIGEHSTVGNDAFLDGRCGISIGSCCNIAAEVRIYTQEHDIDDPDFRATGAPVVIEDYAYLGSRVTVLPGVRIGRGAVVASGAVVTADVADHAVVGGVPARFIRERPRDLRYRLGRGRRFQ